VAIKIWPSAYSIVHAKIQCLKTGPIQLRKHTPTEKHAGLDASRWQPHPRFTCNGPVTCTVFIKTLTKSSKGRSGPTLNMTIRPQIFGKLKVATWRVFKLCKLNFSC
jgi:hypothetical protein